MATTTQSLHLLQLPSSTSLLVPLLSSANTFSEPRRQLTTRSSSTSPSFCFCYARRTKQQQQQQHGLLIRGGLVVLASSSAGDIELLRLDDDDDEEDVPATPQDLEYVQQIQTVLALLKKNRDMLFGEVKLTIAIEDAREVERRRLLGIEELDGPTREDLAAVLEEVNVGKVPRDRVALRMLAEEMTQWPNLEVEPKKSKPRQSMYAKATDTGVDPAIAAKRVNVDWDAAAEIEELAEENTEVPAALGYGALYLVTAFPVIIGISVVLILFYNSLQ